MRRVLDGGAGEESGGNDERSSERPDRDRLCDNEGDELADCGGELLLRWEDCLLTRLPLSTSVMVADVVEW